MELDFYKEARTIWSHIAGDSQLDKLTFELEVHKKLLNIFQVGDFYYYIFNIKNAAFEFISPEIIDVLGYDPDTVTVSFYMSKIHPDDRPYFLNFENRLRTFFKELPIEKIYNYKVRYDFRVKNSKNEYVRLLHQAGTVQHDQGNLMHSLCVHTDISHLKPSGTPVLSFIGMEGEPSFINVGVKELFKPTKNVLTPRELNILKLLISGHTSQQIAYYLHIAKSTAATHRRNILRKTKCQSTYELISKSINEGWM
jgi:DNA-binding CsgD family transcriptional regulator